MYGYFVGDDPRQQEDPYLLDAGSAGNAINMTVGPQQSMPAQPQIMNPQQPSPGMNDLFKSLAMPQQGPIGTNAAYQAAQASPQQQPTQQWASRASGMADASLIQGPSNPYAGQATIDDGFHGGYTGGAMPPQWNQQMTRNPYASLPFTDSFMDNGPIHTLGVSGFRTGSSRPSVDTHGMDQRAAIGRQSMAMMDMIGRQENAANANQIDMARFGMQSADRQDAVMQKRQSEFDHAMQKTPPGARGSIIDQAEQNKAISPETAKAERLRDLMFVAEKMGGGLGKDGRPNSLEGYIRGFSGIDPTKVSRLDVIKQLERLGVTADEIAGLSGRPGLEKFAPSLLNPVIRKDATTEERSTQLRAILGRAAGIANPGTLIP